MTYIRPGFMVVIVGATLTSISSVIVALRFYCRYCLMGSVSASDNLMLTALVFTWVNFVINYYQDETSSRSRPSQAGIPEKSPELETAVRGILITWWMYRVMYIVALCFAKLSILYFYRAIATKKTFRHFIHATIAFVSLYSFAAAVAGIFQCNSPSESWNTDRVFAQFDPNSAPPQAKPVCFDPTKLLIFCGAANLFTDIVILLLPIPIALGLRIPMSKRLALIGIFSVGLVAIIASSVRMYFMMLWAQSAYNSARYGDDLLLWGQVEINAGIISASVPFLRLLFTERGEVQEQAVAPPRVVDIGPPIPMVEDRLSQTRQLPLETWGDVEKQGNNPRWGPFITVPKSLSLSLILSSGSRYSMSSEPEPVRPHSTI